MNLFFIVSSLLFFKRTKMFGDRVVPFRYVIYYTQKYANVNSKMMFFSIFMQFLHEKGLFCRLKSRKPEKRGGKGLHNRPDGIILVEMDLPA